MSTVHFTSSDGRVHGAISADERPRGTGAELIADSQFKPAELAGARGSDSSRRGLGIHGGLMFLRPL